MCVPFCARLGLPRPEWTHYLIQGLRPEIRDYVILQQADHLDEADNFAQLKEFFFLASPMPNIEITSWKARAYGIFTRVGVVSESNE